MILKTIVSLFFLIFLLRGYGQSFCLRDSSSHPAVMKAMDAFLLYMNKESSLYNGPVYIDYRYKYVKGSPFLMNSENPAANILYNGLWYKNIFLLYDVYLQKLITQESSGGKLFEISRDKICAFELAGRRFIKMDTVSYKNMASGFYELLYNGVKSQVFAKHIKEQNEDLDGVIASYTLSDRSIYYIKHDNGYYNINTVKDLRKVYKSKEDGVKIFLKSNKLNFKKDPGNTIMGVAEYFEN